MQVISTEAWVLHRGESAGVPGKLVRETFTFDDIGPDEVLARPLRGCWEGNMDHSIRRSPIDICELRGESKVVIGNAGVVEILRTGSAVDTVREGDVCIVFCAGKTDEHGYPETIFGYDAKGTIGCLAKTTKLHQRQVVPVPAGSRFSLEQWAAFSLRYITAWANWNVAWGCFRAQLPEVPAEDVFVCGWGGGVALAELELAKLAGCRVAMITSQKSRLAQLAEIGIDGIDRGAFGEKTFEEDFLAALRERTGGRGVSIFIDNIGANYRSTLKALAREGVLCTTGWKRVMTYPTVRSMECIARHIHVFTHYARYVEGLAAVAFAEARGWMAPREGRTYAWDEIPQLADDYAAGIIESYFPIYAVNPPTTKS
ncbi:zinc-binding dehydrogenase [Polyangium spumosum]|nr:zinc-binding dehydrogenase [Polyangium spumosum]